MGAESIGGVVFLSAILFFVCIQLAQAQDLLPMQGDGHPAARPNFEHHDVAREMLFSEQHNMASAKLVIENSMPPDTLIDPEGRIVIDTNTRRQRRCEQLEEEAKLLESVAWKEGRKSVHLRTWLMTILGCACVVACGVVPGFVLPINSGAYLQTTEGRRKLNLMLSFAVGSLLGDVFLHLLPEVWASYRMNMMGAGIWTASGLLMCFIIEKSCSSTEDSQRRVCAMMNLVANFIDNFTHGLAIGGSFLVGSKFGLLTTFAIVIHELPHEISDFAILLRADFSIWSAIRAQLFTASGGVIGAFVALYLHTGAVMGGAAQWILPFTAGGFLNISLAQILPELMQETNPRQNVLQLLLLFSGIATMAVLNQFH